MIAIDGQLGGGQLLRSALSLSLVTGQPFHMTAIRGGRPKPGLMRQHLTAVNAAVTVSGGSADGAVLGSTELVFAPGVVNGGDYHFPIGTAGSACLVFQTLLPALWSAERASTLCLEGGTHNPMAPTFDFIDRCFLPVVRRMGGRVDVTLERHGFFPAGGGAMTARVEPSILEPVSLLERGKVVSREIRVVSAHVPDDVGRRESEVALEHLRTSGFEEKDLVVEEVPSAGPGNVVMVCQTCEAASEMTIAFGERGRSGRQVAREAAAAMQNYLGTGAVVGRQLADQLLLPMALAGAGEFVTLTPSNHTRTNAALIHQFLEAEIAMVACGRGTWRVSVV